MFGRCYIRVYLHFNVAPNLFLIAALSFLLTPSVENVYKIGLMAELTGSTKTAIHTFASCFGSRKSPVKDKIPRIIIGIQQKKSVKTMKNNLVALVDSAFTICLTDEELINRKAVQNIETYAINIHRNAMPFNVMKNAVEYSQPAGLPSES